MKRKYRKVDQENGTKECGDCEEVKILAYFPVRKSGVVYPYCKACSALRARIWSSKNKERKAATNAAWASNNRDLVLFRAKENGYMARYGITKTEAIERLAKQSFRCAICKTGLTEKNFYLDHCHTTSKVRGCLCNRCNVSLAPLERPDWLSAATAYLESHRSGS